MGEHPAKGILESGRALKEIVKFANRQAGRPEDYNGPGEWMTIESAPKDEAILLFSKSPKARYKIVVGRWKEQWGWQSEPGAWPVQPSHWMELPHSPD